MVEQVVPVGLVDEHPHEDSPQLMVAALQVWRKTYGSAIEQAALDDAGGGNPETIAGLAEMMGDGRDDADGTHGSVNSEHRGRAGGLRRGHGLERIRRA